MNSILLVLLVASSGLVLAEEELDWWQPGIVYQIYPRSFNDFDGDGVGDLKGITEKAEYLKELGVTAVWLSPIYPSPQKDFGYDVADYTGIDELFGTMEDFENMTATLEEKGIHVILDIVPNHSSNEHEWFKKSVNKIPPYTDYYVWRNGNDSRVHNYPSNWTSNFDGSIWEWNEQRQQYYLHQFLIEQPDLNYNSSIVLDEMMDVLSFWSSKNVKGFRFDAVSSIWEDLLLRDEPMINCANGSNYGCFYHEFTFEQDRLYPVLASFKQRLDELKTVDNITRVMMTESYTTNWNHIAKYYDVTNFPFNFFLISNLTVSSTGAKWVEVINSWYGNTTELGWASWVVGNHDQPRAATRFGQDMVDPINMVILILKGTAVTYNGEELGMVNSFVRADQTKDPQGLRTGDPSRSRDPNRGPMIWNDTRNAGFTSADQPWLPIQSTYWRDNAKVQMASNRSHFSVYKRMAKLRQTYLWQFGECSADVLVDPNVVGIFRWKEDNPTIMLLINFGEDPVDLNLQSLRSSTPPDVYLYAVSAAYSSDHQFGQQLNSSSIQLLPRSSITLLSQSLDIPIRTQGSKFTAPADFE